MRTFLIVFFLIYGSMHVYAFMKSRPVLPANPALRLLLIIVMAAMVISPVIVRYSERLGYETTARIVSYVGYHWMGILLLFVSTAFAIDIYRLILYLASRILKSDLSLITPLPGFSFFVPLMCALIVSGYGYFEARDVRIETIAVETSKIPKETGKIKIVQISDVHLGLIVRQDRLRIIIDAVKKAEPDMLVSTGDLVDGQINRLEGLAELLQEVKPRYGKFAVTGNHEFYAGVKQSLEFITKAGFTPLRGEVADIGGIINVAGVDDRTGKQFGIFQGASEKNLLSGLDRDKFTILLKHRPLIDKDAQGLFDLQLSGHTHKGQIFPFSLITRLYYPKHAGYLDLPGHSAMYVSRGTGTWGPPIRFLSPPEITVIELAGK